MLVVSLFDESGNMVRPWAEAGHACYCFDLLNEDKETEYFPSVGFIKFFAVDLSDDIELEFIRGLRPDIIFSFPPCDDMAVSGSKHFESKLARDPLVHEKAVALARTAEKLGEALGCPWMAENPVSILSSAWRKPDFIFDPFEFGGYLPLFDTHPRWPKYIAPRDSYKKATCIWHGNGFVEPERKPVPFEEGLNRQTLFLGGKSARTKLIRAETPRGFALAVFRANEA
jgi:hypothetical protein